MTLTDHKVLEIIKRDNRPETLTQPCIIDHDIPQAPYSSITARIDLDEHQEVVDVSRINYSPDIPAGAVCPEGMYPTLECNDANEHTSVDNFTALREWVESVVDDYNLPLTYRFGTEGDPDDDEFVVVIFLPRKLRTMSISTDSYDYSEALEWVNSLMRRAVDRWYGWSETPTPQHEASDVT